MLCELKTDPAISEVLILSTCNRTEIYVSGLDEEDIHSKILEKLFSLKKIVRREGFQKYFYTLEGEDVVRHLFEVAAGLDSLVLGEAQILGQLKSAIDKSCELGLFWKKFNILSNLAIRVGKKAQTETDIGIGGVSVSWSAINLTEKKLGGFKGKSLLIIGCGKMAKLTGEALSNKGLKNIFVMNRTFSNAVNLAYKIDGIPVGFWDLKKVMSEVDVCICSVGSPHYIIEKEVIKEAFKERNEKSLLLVDISMPRSIDPVIKIIPFVELVSIDQLDQCVEDNLLCRKKAVKEVEEIIDCKLKEYHKKMEKIEMLEQGITEKSLLRTGVFYG